MEKKLQPVANVSLKKNTETDNKILKLISCNGNHRNKRRKPPRRNNFCPKNMQSYGFLNRKLKEPSIKRSSEHYMLRWMKMKLEVKSWRFRKASSLKELSKFSKFLRIESGKSSKQEFEQFIPTSQTFQEPRSYIPLQAVTYNSAPKWQTHDSDLIKPFIQGSWWVIAVPQTSGLNQRCWWHLGNRNQKDTPSYRYSSTTIAFTRVS